MCSGALGGDGAGDCFRHVQLAIWLSGDPQLDHCVKHGHAAGGATMMHRYTEVFRMRSSTRIPRTTVGGLLCAKDEEGSNLVEFALIFLVMMAMILGIIDFCRVAYSYHFVSKAAREATR